MTALRLAYADPPYPGFAHLYPENTEVDHCELIARLERDYDGWALSTAESTLAQVLALAPAGVRVLAWCRPDMPPFRPNPYASWEPVLCRPARKTNRIRARSYIVEPGPLRGISANVTLVGAKSPAFCQWLINCIGAEREDSMDDLFPGSGVMGSTWERWVSQPELPGFRRERGSRQARANRIRRVQAPLPGLDAPGYHPERVTGVSRADRERPPP